MANLIEASRSEEGVWRVAGNADEGGSAPDPAYLEKLAASLNALDPIFEQARDRCEFEFVLSLIRVRGVQDPGWDPYETTLEAVPLMLEAGGLIESLVAQRHLQLWIYLHILEASEPYELLGNLLDVAAGGRFYIERFRPKSSGAPLSPGTKIRRLKKAAERAGVKGCISQLEGCWDAAFRNAIAHADYSFFGNDLRILSPVRSYSREQVFDRAAGAVAHDAALSTLYRAHIESYTDPVILKPSPGWGGDPEGQAVTIIREGYGLVGLRDTWSREAIRAGKIPWRMVRIRPSEWRLLEEDPERVILPPLSDSGNDQQAT
jgi:hypothetical protein